MSKSHYQAAIIGAGPYGLAAAAHLRSANREICIFGEPMEFWQNQMPKGMLLRSSWDASRISDPHQALTLNTYRMAVGAEFGAPVPLDHFIAYGQWFQRQIAPDLDRRRVTRVEPSDDGFQLHLADGAAVQAERVIVAGGIAPFAYRPPQFDALPPALASHTADHQDLSRFAGRQIVIIGSGQSAIESAALLAEVGAQVEVIMRAPALRWLSRSGWLHSQQGLLRRLLYPATDVGPPVLNQLVAAPELFRRLPRGLQTKWAYRAIRPAAAGWLRGRVDQVRLTSGCNVVSAYPAQGRLRITLDDRSERLVDHVLLATGYRVDIARYAFLAPELVQSLRVADGYPILSAGFESSVPGLHFLGAPSAWSFGPLMRFVSGTWFTANALTQHIQGARHVAVKKEGRSWPTMAQ